MKLYLAGPLFTAGERAWNAQIADALRSGGHEVFLPQDQESGMPASAILATDIGGIDWADALVAIMDGPDPDSGTAWECGYAYGRKPTVLIRTDMPVQAASDAPYNAMLTGSADIRLDLPLASTAELKQAVLDALATLEARR